MLLRDYPRTDFGNLTVDGVQASAVLRAKIRDSPVPTIPTAAGTTEVNLPISIAGTVTAVRFAAKDALAAHDTNFITFALVNRGPTGIATTAMLAATAANTTKVTGGSALGAYTARLLALSATPANLAVAVGDTLSFQVTGAGTLANTITAGSVQLIIDAPG